MSILEDYVTQVERYEPHLSHLTERTLRVDTPEIYFLPAPMAFRCASSVTEEETRGLSSSRIASASLRSCTH